MPAPFGFPVLCMSNGRDARPKDFCHFSLVCCLRPTLHLQCCKRCRLFGRRPMPCPPTRHWVLSEQDSNVRQDQKQLSATIVLDKADWRVWGWKEGAGSMIASAACHARIISIVVKLISKPRRASVWRRNSTVRRCDGDLIRVQVTAQCCLRTAVEA